MLKQGLLGLALVLGTMGGPAVVQAAAPDYVKLQTVKTQVLVLGTGTDFAALEKQAREIARRMNMPYSLQGMVYDARRGLILPDSFPDAAYAGKYALRRYDQLQAGRVWKGFVSIEKSDAYSGMKPGLYFIMGGIEADGKAAARRVAAFRKVARGAYAARTAIYMGCMH
jgi:hypothetical protein